MPTTPLHKLIAAKEDKFNEFCIELGKVGRFLPNIADDHGYTLIMLCAIYDKVDFARILINYPLKPSDEPIDFEVLDKEKRNLYHLTALYGSIEMMKFFLAPRGQTITQKFREQIISSLTTRDNNGRDCCFLAAEQGHIKILELIESRVPNIRLDTKDNLERNPLMVAGMNGHQNCVEFILKVRPSFDVSSQDIEGKNSLILNIIHSHTQKKANIVDFLLNLKPALKIHTPDGSGRNALMWAILYQDNAIINSLKKFSSNLQIDLDINHRDNQGDTALIMAVDRIKKLDKNDFSIVYFLLDSFPDLDLNIPDGAGRSAVMKIIPYPSEFFYLFVYSGLKINVMLEDAQQYNLLMHIVVFGSLDQLQLLLERYPKAYGLLLKKDNNQQTPLMHCILQGKLEMAEYLTTLTPKPDLTATDLEGNNVFMIAAEKESAAMIRLLLTCPLAIDLNSPNKRGLNAFIMIAKFALKIKDPSLLTLLLTFANPENIHSGDSEGRNILMLACIEGEANLVALIRNHHPSPDIKQRDHKGNTAIFIALQAGHSHLIATIYQPKTVLKKPQAEAIPALKLGVAPSPSQGLVKTEPTTTKPQKIKSKL